MPTTKPLHLDHVKIDPGLMRALPAEIARRYQALPISTDGRQITVAMAHPEDPTACQAVSSAMGVPACMIQVDPGEIEHLLAEIWPENPSLLRMLLWIATPDLPEDQPYAQSLAEALHAELKSVHIPWRGGQSFHQLVSEAGQFDPDLILFQIPEPDIMHRLLMDFTINKLIERLRASILVFKEPRWPLNKLMLVIRDGNENGVTAVDWTIRLAKNSQTSVTILPLLPPVPEMYGSCLHHSLPALLTANDPLGQRMRWIALRLSSERIKGTIKLRNDTPLEQLHGELSESDVDLVVIAAEPKNHLWRWLFGEVVNDLFAGFDRPLLITQPILS